MAAAVRLFATLLFILIVLFAVTLVSGFALPRINVHFDARPGTVLTEFHNEGQSSELDPPSSYLSITDDGRLLTTRPLVDLLGTSLTVHVTHRKGGSSWNEWIIVRVINSGKDSKLHFADSRYEGVITENNPVGQKVQGLSDLRVTVPVYAQDMPVQYELLGPGSEKFHQEVSEDDSIVRVYASAELHVAEKEFYKLTLEAVVNDEVAVTEVHILVLGLHPPVFIFPQFIYSIAENAPNGTVAGTVFAADEDRGANGHVTYHFLKPNRYFKLGQETGKLTVASPPPAGEYNMQVVARDDGTPSLESAPVPLQISVVSASSGKIPYGNDMLFPPDYKPSKRLRRDVLPEQRVPVPENTTVNTVIYNIASVNDTDRFAFVNNPGASFGLNETTGEVILLAELNYEETTQYNLDIQITNVENADKSDTQRIIIEVQNVDEPPQWEMIVYPYIEVVPVDAPSGASLYQLRASDPEGFTVRYYLNSGGSGMFTVDEDSGWIKTSLSPGQTYEQDRKYVLSVYARDENGSSIPAEVNIFGGTHPPQFTKEVYQATVVEEVNPPQNVIDVRAFSFNNLAVTYSLLNNNDVDIRIPRHTISASSGQITLLDKVDREKLSSYFLDVRATEDTQSNDGLSTTVRVNVDVTDINDCNPVFGQKTYSFRNIPETIGTDTLIGSIEATDCDADPNNILTYTLSGAQAEKFRVVGSGDLYPASKLDFDVGEGFYELRATVRDQAGGTAEAIVWVYLTDLNDEPPVFLNTENYVYYVDEDAVNGYIVGTVYASDADKDSVITFSLQGTYPFRIDSATGVISHVGTNNLPEASYSFNVTATDGTYTSYAEVEIVVNDINDNPPVFQDCANYAPSISEDAADGTSLITVVATDADKGANAEIKYNIPGANIPFRVDADTGEIFLQDPLDRERNPTIDIVVTATDQPTNSFSKTGFCVITVNVTDVNDNRPVFRLERYFVSVSSSTSARQIILTVNAEDADAQSSITYRLTKQNPVLFGIYQTGEIFPLFSLSTYEGRTFNFEVVADDSVREGTSNIEVKVLAASAVDQPPVWVTVFEDIRLQENRTVPWVIKTLEATPKSSNEVGFSIVIGQIPETNSEAQFGVRNLGGENKAELNLDIPLDFEVTSEYSLQVDATDDGTRLSSFGTQKVIVEDVNDETPQFTLSRFFAAVPEEATPPSDVITVAAVDADTVQEFRTITYSFDTSFPDAQFFTINGVTGQIFSQIKFDREVKDEYALQVIATDGAPSSNPSLGGEPNKDYVRVTINVVDINDNPPVFSSPIYNVVIREDQPVGYEIIRVTATDVDSDSVPRYLITANNTGGVFDVDPATGQISIASPLDYETQTEYWLQYSATDGLNVEYTTIRIQVTNVNDERPVFSQPVYRDNVAENDANVPRQLLQVSAEDGDADADQGAIRYSLEGSGTDGVFSINSQDGWISLNQELDREAVGLWKFLVKATDGVGTPTSLTGYADVEVTVLDQNDNDPFFPELEYRGSVPENSVAGTQVMQVTAIDYDDPTDFGRLTYSTVTASGIDNDGSALFEIDPSSGWVTVKSGASLDRETQDMYTLRIRAEDISGTFAQTDAIIEILDLNDNKPEFIGGPYTTAVLETEPVGATVYEVSVSDPDIGFADEVQFGIVSGNVGNRFEIVADPLTLVGLIRIANPLDYEALDKQYVLQLTVTDNANGQSQTSITINVQDVNDVAPRFLPSNEYIAPSVLENVAVGTLIKTVTATDPEEGAFGLFTFAIDAASDRDGLFTISAPIGSGAERTAEVRTAKALDRETVETHVLTLLAIDQGVPALTGTATLNLTLEDINDTPPTFAQDYRPMIRENYPEIQSVGTISAKDSDPTGGAPFTLVVEPNTDTESFTWRDVGENQLNISSKPVSFDREVQAFYSIPIRITDLAPNGNSAVNILVVEIEDENDNPHVGISKDMLVYSFEGNIPESPIGVVGVSDPDTVEDKTYTPNLSETLKQYFRVDADSGKVTILAGTPADTYSFTVLVRDDGTFPDQTSTVNVEVRDISEEAVRSSGSFRFQGMTAEDLVSLPVGGGQSKLDVLKGILADIVPAKSENIDIFSVINVPGETDQVDVRYSAHGSPYYPPEKLDGAALENKKRIEDELGLTIGMIKIDMCLLESVCESACTNVLEINPQPTLVNTPTASFTSVTTRVVAQCECGANIRQPGPCDFDACVNGGTCTNTQGGGHTCDCPTGFDGPDCQQTTREFKGQGFAHFGTLQQCEDTHTSLEFITTMPEGVLLYNGPMIPLTGDMPQDFILIQLVGGQPQLQIDLGSGSLTLSIPSARDLGDGKWHRLDVYRNGKDVEFMLDRCKDASVAEVSSSSTRQTDQCKQTGQTPGGNKFLNVNTPLQLGGRDLAAAFTYPSNISFASSYNGCMKDVEQDSTLYDLQTPGKVSNSDPGCSRLACGECNNGTCVGDFDSYVCLCKPGFTGTTCDQATPAYDFALDSYVRYQLKAPVAIDSREGNYMVVFRTRQKEGLLWTITNANRLEFTTIELIDGYIRSRWNLGDGEHSVYLNQYAVDDGSWHSVHLERYDFYVTVRIDGGGGVRQAENRDSTFSTLEVDPNSVLVGAFVVRVVEISQDFQGCMNDPRINNFYLGFKEDSTYATPQPSSTVTEGCPSYDPCASDPCPAPFICVDLWRKYECQCKPGFYEENGQCINIDACVPNPCLNGGTCTDLDVGYKCDCTEDYLGENCGTKRERVASPLGFGIGAILALLLCLLIIILLLLAFVFYKRDRDRKQALAFAIDPEDDIRENFINYDEECGEEDQDSYDVSTLRKPVVPVTMDDFVKPPTTEAPLSRAPRLPGDDPNVGDFINDRLKDANDDPDAYPNDSLKEYDYEGEGSSAGTLSSLNSSSTDGDQNYDYLNDWGPPFKKLADMYGGGEDD